MPPKAKARASSGGPAKAKAKAKGKAKAAAAPAEDPKVTAAKEAEEEWERWKIEDGGQDVIKLAQFAELIRDMNSKKCMLWGDDPANIIRREWNESGGNVQRLLTLDKFKAWWPDFRDKTNKEADDKLAEQEAAAGADAARKAEKYGGDGVWQIMVEDLKEAFEQALKKGKTPLVIDNTEGHRSETYLQYTNAYVVECKKWIVEKAKGATVEDILGEEQRRFFEGGHCFKFGSTILFRLSNTACDLRGTWSTPIFPSCDLLDRQAIEKCMGPENADNIKISPFRSMPPTKDEDFELQAMGIHPKFQVVMVTHFTEEDYAEFLEKVVPLDLLQPMKVSMK